MVAPIRKSTLNQMQRSLPRQQTCLYRFTNSLRIQSKIGGEKVASQSNLLGQFWHLENNFGSVARVVRFCRKS